jgi:hypothetical protein
MHRTEPTVPRNIRRALRRVVSVLLLVLVGRQLSVPEVSGCMSIAGNASVASTASTAHDHMGMPDHAPPARAPAHRTNCDQINMAGSCTTCAVLPLGVTVITDATHAVSTRAFAFPAALASASDVAPDVPPPRA